MQKVDGVQSVRVSLNEGLTTLDLKPGNAVTLARIRQVIKNNGFVSTEANIVARGSANNPQTFMVSGTNEELTPSAPPTKVEDAWHLTVSSPHKP
jgi:hypothetical protein